MREEVGWDVMTSVAIHFHFCLNSLSFYRQGSSFFLLKGPSVVHGGEEFVWKIAATGAWVPPGWEPGTAGAFVPHTHLPWSLSPVLVYRAWLGL